MTTTKTLDDHPARIGAIRAAVAYRATKMLYDAATAAANVKFEAVYARDLPEDDEDAACTAIAAELALAELLEQKVAAGRALAEAAAAFCRAGGASEEDAATLVGAGVNFWDHIAAILLGDVSASSGHRVVVLAGGS